MSRQQTGQPVKKTSIETLDQISAGGVAFRQREATLEMAIILVKPDRWQLPKGIVDPGKSPQATAIREVREEAGIETNLLALIETIEYWYRATQYGKPVRFHKFVHFYLLEYLGGDVSDHDHEVQEARWVSFEQALDKLTFKGERAVAQKAQQMILETSRHLSQSK